MNILIGFFVFLLGQQPILGFLPPRHHPFTKNLQKTKIPIGFEESLHAQPPPTTTGVFLPGLFLGIPLNILSAIFTYHHYHDLLLSPKIIALNCLVGFYTYGNDRIKDAIVYVNQGLTSKEELKYLSENRDILKNIYDSAYLIFVILLFDNFGTSFQTLGFLSIYETIYIQYPFLSFYLGVRPTYLFCSYLLSFWIMWGSHQFSHEFTFLPFLLALDSTNYYIRFKKRYGFLKPFYVAFMWVGAFLLMPIVVREQGWDGVDFSEIWSPFFMMAGLSNLLDIRDIESDRGQGIKTLPVLVGETVGIAISVGLLILAKIVL